MLNLLKILKKQRYSTIFPLTDDTVLKLSQHRKLIEPYSKLAFPEHASVLIALNKYRTIMNAVDLGIPIPKTLCVNYPEKIQEISKNLSYPVVIKPVASYSWQPNGKALYSRHFFAKSPTELLELYEKVGPTFPSLMIQEYISGYNVSVGMLYANGEVLAACCIRVYRAFPVAGGTSVLRETIPPNAEMIKYASDLLNKLKWHGIAEVEFRVDSKDGKPKLMEINPRFWGSMDVAIASGIDFPYLLFLIARGDRVDPISSYKIGVKSYWLNGDVQILQSILDGSAVMMGSDFLSKAEAIIRFLRFYDKGVRYEGASFRDPLPFLVNEFFFSYGLFKTFFSRHI